MTEVQVERMRKLANHLISGKLGHKKFTMQTYSSGPRQENGCGTAGCALGECPFLFPDDWTFLRYSSNYDVPRLHGAATLGYYSACQFFGIPQGDVDALFGVDATLLPQGGRRAKNPRAKTVGRYLLSYIEWATREGADEGAL